MLGTRDRNIKLLGATWLVLGGTVLFVALDLGHFGLVFSLVLLVWGSVQVANGLTLLLRYPVARRLLAISSLVLLIPSIYYGVFSFNLAGIPILLVVVASLWLTLSKDGKKAFESYIAREDGSREDGY